MSSIKNNNFLSYVIPSVLASALSGVYTIVDGFFIGNSMGDAGLAAVTIGFPVSAFIQAVGTGIGLAGAIQFAILAAKEEKQKERQCFTGTAILMLLVSALFTLFFFVFTEEVLHLFGATGEIHTMAVEYVRIIALGTVFQLLATGLVPFIRNMNGAPFAMVAMILGFVTNIILDYLLVWVVNGGMAGAAWATIIGQAVTLVAAVLFFVRKKYRISFASVSETVSLWGRVLKVSLSPFGLSFSSQLTLLFMNKFLLTYGSAQSVAVFGCIDYLLCIIYLLLQGVGDGSQPLISNCYGKGDHSGMKHMRDLAYKFAVALALIFAVTFFLLRGQVGVLFGASESANLEVIHYLPWFLATLVFLSFTRITTTYFYATEKTLFSYILVYGESISTLIMLCVLPLFLDITGVWLAMPVSQILMFTVALFTKKHIDRKTFSEVKSLEVQC